MQAGEEDAALVALLGWYREMGVDAATSGDAVDWLARGGSGPGAGFELPRAPQAETRSAGPLPAGASTRSERTTRGPAESSAHPPPDVAGASARQAPRPSPQAAPPRADLARSPARPSGEGAAAETEARRMASAARSLEELGAALARFDRCELKSTAKNLCHFRGAERTRLMLIGEAPGREEDLAGKPFVGPAGQLLDRILLAAGFAEADVHITNVVYWRPPGNRVPTPQETSACWPFLERQVELVAPDVVVLLGGAATKQVLATQDGIMRIRGAWRDVTIGRHACRAMPTLHPAFLLRTPASKRLIWRDFLEIKAALSAV